MKTVALTAAGEAARDTGLARLAETEAQWGMQFGGSEVAALRDALTSLVRQIDVELPHYPSGYGQGDTSIHGGAFVPGQEGPPRIPAHGEEWPVVLREDRTAVDTLPVSALLSQALCAFAIDYDATAESVLAGLHTAITFLRFVDADGIPLAEAKALGQVNGSGRAGFERHRLVNVEAKVAYLTEHGARVRDRYPARVAEIETDWAARYGDETVRSVRGALEGFDPGEDGGVADYVDVSGWLKRR